MKTNSSERGMVKWMPYRSLVEQESFLLKMQKEKEKTPKPLISSDQAEEINQALLQYQGEPVIAFLWARGEKWEEEGVIERIDSQTRTFLLNGKRMPLSSLYRLEVL